MDLFYDFLGLVSEEASFLILGIVVLLIAKILKDYLTPYKITQELVSRDNPALGLSITGYYLGVVAIYIGTIVETGDEIRAVENFMEQGNLSWFAYSLLESFGYSMVGLVLLNIGRLIVNRCVLYKFDTVKEIITDKNSGTGAVEFGNYLATGLVIGGAVSGAGGGLLTMLAFFLLGQIILVAYAFIYQWITPYDIHYEIERDNVAAGVAMGGNLVAAGIIMLKGVSGDFISWTENLQTFFLYVLVGITMLLIFRLLVDIFLLPGVSMAKEISEDQNINAGYIESGLLIGFSAIIFFTI